MNSELSQFEQRKQDHIELALMPENQASEKNIFDSITLQHEALPSIDFENISIESLRFGKPTQTPFIVSSMTAGHQQSINLNRNLIAACDTMHWAMGVGSQRRELTDAHASNEWLVLRKYYPNVALFSNIGIAQLITTPIEQIQRIIASLQASAIIVHCNPLQECIQPEGTPFFKGCFEALEQLAKHIQLPIIVKETGCGFSLATLKRLNNIGIAAVDISGLGGTHWGRIEGHRTESNTPQQHAAVTFRNWGINTITSLQYATSIQPNYEVWGSGGVRHGLDAAKLLALGATTVGFAKPMLASALESIEAVIECMRTIEYELKVAMFCTGSSTLNELRGKI